MTRPAASAESRKSPWTHRPSAAGREKWAARNAATPGPARRTTAMAAPPGGVRRRARLAGASGGIVGGRVGSAAEQLDNQDDQPRVRQDGQQEDDGRADDELGHA